MKALAHRHRKQETKKRNMTLKKAALLARGVMPYLVARQSQVSKNGSHTCTSTPTQTHPHFYNSILHKNDGEFLKNIFIVCVKP